MPTSARVRNDPFSSNGEWLDLGTRSYYCVDLVGMNWRIYEAWGDYTTTSGGHIRKGQVIRRYDGEFDGQIGNFRTKEEAIAWAKKFLASSNPCR